MTSIRSLLTLGLALIAALFTPLSPLAPTVHAQGPTYATGFTPPPIYPSYYSSYLGAAQTETYLGSLIYISPSSYTAAQIQQTAFTRNYYWALVEYVGVNVYQAQGITWYEAGEAENNDGNVAMPYPFTSAYQSSYYGLAAAQWGYYWMFGSYSASAAIQFAGAAGTYTAIADAIGYQGGNPAGSWGAGGH